MSRYLSRDVPSELDRWLFDAQRPNESTSSEEISFSGDVYDGNNIAVWRRQYWSTKSVLELGAGLGKCEEA